MVAKKVGAIVLAAGQGKRMGGHVPKQYMLLGGRPLLSYSLQAFEESSVDRVILVAGSDQCDYCRQDLVEAFGFSKVTHIVEGGKERYHSVYQGLKQVLDCDYVLIHDGARPFVTVEIIERCIEAAKTYGACVAAMPCKDTVKLVDEEGYARLTPDRKQVYQIQTPQAFSTGLIWSAYESLFSAPGQEVCVTDDAMVVEHMTEHKVRMIEGSYKNIKVTTPEDLAVGEALLKL